MNPLTRFSVRKVIRKVIKVEFDTKPDLHSAHDEHHAEAKLTQAMIRH